MKRVVIILLLTLFVANISVAQHHFVVDNKIVIAGNEPLLDILYSIDGNTFQKIPNNQLKVSKDKMFYVWTGYSFSQIELLNINFKLMPDYPFEFVEKMPQFPGGDLALRKYIAINVNYPKEALEKGIQGKVSLRFIVETNGEVSNIKILKSDNKIFDSEAIKVIQTLPKFIPGKHKGKNVRVSLVQSVIFKLG